MDVQSVIRPISTENHYIKIDTLNRKKNPRNLKLEDPRADEPNACVKIRQNGLREFNNFNENR